MSAKKTQTASRPVVGLSDEQTPEPRKTAFLPPELMLAIFECMVKHELKKVRMVSREWSTFATPLLFDRVYISPREVDLTVFHNITQHPGLGPVVREIIYDTSRFQQRMSQRDYFDRLCHDLNHCFVYDNGDLKWHSYALISALKLEHRRDEFSIDTRDKLYEKHRKDDFVRRGYKRCRQYAKCERRTAERTPLPHTLSRGIQRLNGVRSFAVIGTWTKRHSSTRIPQDLLQYGAGTGSTRDLEKPSIMSLRTSLSRPQLTPCNRLSLLCPCPSSKDGLTVANVWLPLHSRSG